jgi:transcriptional regulator with XRE-family HTH domain
MMKKTTEELMEILKQKKSIHAYFTEEIDELEFASLTEYLELLLNEKGLRKSDVIKRSNMDKNYAYQIFNGNKTHPSRDKMIALAIGMGLNVLETRKLLKIAGACDLTQHPNYKLTSDYDPKNTFDIEKYLNRKEKIQPGDEFIVVDADSLPSA